MLNPDKYEIVRRAAKITQRVMIGISCGKDSVVTLDICRNYFLKITGYFMYLVKDLSFQESYLKYLEGRYKIEIIRVPHWQLGSIYKCGAYAPHTQMRLDCPEMDIAEMEKSITEMTGSKWFCYGSRKTESLERSAMIKACNGINEKSGRIYPIADFSTNDIYKYLKLKAIPLSPEYKYLSRSFGCLKDDELFMIKEHYPEDFKKILEVFPYAESAIKRREFANQQVSEV